MDFIKANILSLVIVALLAVVILQRCGGYDKAQSKPDTTYRSDTHYIQQPTVTIPPYQPIIVESKQPVIIPPQYQPATDQTALLKQYQDLVNMFLSANVVNDSILLKDSAGHRVGVVNINDVISENTIKSRVPSYKLTLPVVTNTVTITKPYEPKRQVYAGFELSGSKTQLLNNISAGLIYKDRQDRIFRVKLGTDLKLQPVIGVGTYWKIRL